MKLTELKNKVALITGASSGIGLAAAKTLASQGMHLILVARRIERLKKIQQELNATSPINCQIVELDVNDHQAVEKYLLAVKKIDVLINNAGLANEFLPVQKGSLQKWMEMMNTNVLALMNFTKLTLPLMIANGGGHIVNISSIAGHETYPNGAVYAASKHAVTSFTQGLRIDLLGLPIRATLISPGMVETEFSLVRFDGDADKAKNVYKNLTPLSAEDIADTILYALTRPPHVNINDLIVMPVDQASANHNFRHT